MRIARVSLRESLPPGRRRMGVALNPGVPSGHRPAGTVRYVDELRIEEAGACWKMDLAVARVARA